MHLTGFEQCLNGFFTIHTFHPRVSAISEYHIYNTGLNIFHLEIAEEQLEMDVMTH